MNTLISKQVTYEYRNAVQTVRAVNGVSCAFQQGQVYAIVGSSGSYRCLQGWMCRPPARSS